MKKGRSTMLAMNPRILLAAASLAACAAVTARAHHEPAEGAPYLAFWAGYRPVPTPLPTPDSCRDGVFWSKAFVSIYSQGAE
jgi:hypothetical protein